MSDEKKKLGLIDLLPWIRIILKYANALYPLPLWTDGQAVRAWLKNLVALLKEGAASTSVEIDDDLVDLLDKVLASDDVWQAVWHLVENNLHPERPKYAANLAVYKTNAEAQGFDWQKLLALAMAIAEIIRNFLKQ